VSKGSKLFLQLLFPRISVDVTPLPLSVLDDCIVGGEYRKNWAETCIVGTMLGWPVWRVKLGGGQAGAVQ
jgi:hypothetical protein